MGSATNRSRPTPELTTASSSAPTLKTDTPSSPSRTRRRDRRSGPGTDLQPVRLREARRYRDAGGFGFGFGLQVAAAPGVVTVMRAVLAVAAMVTSQGHGSRSAARSLRAPAREGVVALACFSVRRG